MFRQGIHSHKLFPIDSWTFSLHRNIFIQLLFYSIQDGFYYQQDRRLRPVLEDVSCKQCNEGRGRKFNGFKKMYSNENIYDTLLLSTSPRSYSISMKNRSPRIA
jgi:hypothetical protein